jgi:hypothetical protein
LWYIPVIPAQERQSQEDWKFEASVVNIVSPSSTWVT